jgi:ABC-2 type transport system permease protein/lipopolysaccharide transport system permease protein
MDVQTSATVPPTDYFPPPRAARGPTRWAGLVREDYRELLRFWPVVQNMVIQELRVRYQRSALGFLWTLLHPILMMTTLTLVFSQLFKTTAKDYAIYLFAGMVPWGFLAASLNECAFCIILNEGLIRKIYLPKLVFPVAKVLVNLSTFLLSLGALFILLKPLGAPISWSLVFLPVAIAAFAAFALGLGLIVATANTFYRDCGHLVTVFLQAWYFATPVIYESKFIPEEVRWRFWLNPAFPFVTMFQEILRDGRFPGLSTVLAAVGFAAMSLGVGYVAFKSHENKLVFRL